MAYSTSCSCPLPQAACLTCFYNNHVVAVSDSLNHYIHYQDGATIAELRKEVAALRQDVEELKRLVLPAPGPEPVEKCKHLHLQVTPRGYECEECADLLVPFDCPLARG